MNSVMIYLLFAGLLVGAFMFENRRNPDRLNKIWKTLAVSITVGSLWFLQDRLASFTGSLGYSWVFTLGLLAIIAFVLWGIFTRKPVY